jgi:O-antigen/teichoic acid export membrane protein
MKEYLFNTGHLKIDIKKKAIKGSGIIVLSNAASFVIHLIGTIILARLLTPSDFGLVTMVTTFSLLLQNFGVNGIIEAIIQREDINHTIVNTLFWINLGISLSLTVIFIACAPLIAHFYSEPRLIWISSAIGLSIISTGISAIHQGLLSRNMQFPLLSLIGIISKLISMVITIIVALLGWKYWALVINTILHPLIGTIGAWISCKWRPSILSQRTNVNRMIRFAFNIYGKFALNYGSRNFDNLLVGKYMGIQSLGYYKKAYDLFALPTSSLTAPLSNIALAALSRFSNNHEAFRKYYLSSISRIAFFSMGLSLFLTISAKDIILLILGPQWIKSVVIFMFFGPGIGIMLIYYTHGWLHLSLGRPDRWFRWGVLEFIATGSFLIGGMFFGPTGVACAWTSSFYILTIPALLYAGRPVSLRLKDILSAMWRSVAAALGAGIISSLILFSNLAGDFFPRLNIFLRITSSFSICMLSYFITTILLHRNLKPFLQFVSLIKEMLPSFSSKKQS